MTNFFVICCKHHVFSVSSQFCKNIGPTISATITFRNMLEEVVVEVMDGMEKFFKITSYISINSTFDNDDDDYIHKHGEGGSGGGGGGGDAEVLQICFIHISPLKF